MSGLLLGIVLSVCTCWFHNMVTLPPWLVSTDSGTCSYQCFLSNCTPVSLHMLKCSCAHTLSCLFMYCSFASIGHADIMWCTVYYYYYLPLQPPQWAMASSFTRFLDHTQRRTTVRRTPMDEWSARRTDLYLTTHNTHNRQTSIGLLWTSDQPVAQTSTWQHTTVTIDRHP